ncbi:hypothetical protein EHI8A_096740 [Entamoeba histolytica HM-1:IMSS-B]|uniref:TLDc domain-containing protein n=6 Tax=Entamoeba histolytica TaxID=5759 RepID=C4M1F3_ENTH1|nr:hypothetical protein EHI_030850 [Entamoeba histolytica HM-1:IMSS]EMD43409.1 E3 ubiquitin protein ligase BRE1, putative [Entamoeba histolytica KU27]EMH73556.1 hypothetical protein EHI8A_096740 [Entamoeba histolytica HM-1:IMSS-B]EMS15991.1 E3 ubiquitin protein ligase BRE1, putative [Entamoeba histolytica HM-3:IMSS]ENY59804.1 E3 ubiquitin protein ligase BRE1, putative [Entamoeba histolytica HM-1:IMSS-A]GAT95033.1 hypothetical protein CL6EHI_030850 [Entamoeba histolytica]|eukprot:XP_648564.1 hypothetical protein EHI_030850 [Entamoeba histolytica HM-1:IMSS]
MTTIKEMLENVEKDIEKGSSTIDLMKDIIGILKKLYKKIEQADEDIKTVQLKKITKNTPDISEDETTKINDNITPMIACATIIPPCHSESEPSLNPVNIQLTSINSSIQLSKYISNSKELNSIEKYKKVLKNWTNQRAFKVLYNSNFEGLNCEYLNKKIVGKKDVMVFVFDNEKNIFGGFTRSYIPICKRNDFEYTQGTEEFFVFSLYNNKGFNPIKIERKLGDLGFRISNDNDSVFGIANCFSIITNDRSYIIPSFNKYYNDTTQIGAELLTGNCYPKRFKVKCLIAVQWC